MLKLKTQKSIRLNSRGVNWSRPLAACRDAMEKYFDIGPGGYRIVVRNKPHSQCHEVKIVGVVGSCQVDTYHEFYLNREGEPERRLYPDWSFKQWLVSAMQKVGAGRRSGTIYVGVEEC